MDTDKANNHKYHCCFCGHFQLAGYRWGYCDLLNVYIEGNQDACQVSVPPFAGTEDSIPAKSSKTDLLPG